MFQTVAVLVSVIQALPPNGDRTPSAAVPYHAEGFVLRLPREVRVVKKPSAPDFDLYELTYRDKVILHLYVGNWPDVKPEFLKTGDDMKTQEKGYSIRSITRRSLGGMASRQTLFKLSFRGDGWPAYLHFWYADMPQTAADLADEIIASAKPSTREANEDRKR